MAAAWRPGFGLAKLFVGRAFPRSFQTGDVAPLRVHSRGLASDLNDAELEALGRDPFLIAYGFADASERYVVSFENTLRASNVQTGKYRMFAKI
jgi:hypothetical protein